MQESKLKPFRGSRKHQPLDQTSSLAILPFLLYLLLLIQFIHIIINTIYTYYY